jgi:hypothetical protein
VKNRLLERRLAGLQAKENIGPPRFEFWVDEGDGYLRKKDGTTMTREAFEAAYPNAIKFKLNLDPLPSAHSGD